MVVVWSEEKLIPISFKEEDAAASVRISFANGAHDALSGAHTEFCPLQCTPSYWRQK